jgi:transcription elongation factor Elf1
MTARRSCPRCGKVGVVRAERVIKAGHGVTELACGACEHTWTENDERPISKEEEEETR